jgi:uncharacterized protein YvpB
MKKYLFLLVALFFVFHALAHAKGSVIPEDAKNRVAGGASAAAPVPHPATVSRANDSGLHTASSLHAAAAATPSAPVASQAAVSPAPSPADYLLHVPGQSQGPELYNGCEVTSVSMLLAAVGHPVSKMILADAVPKDPTPETVGENGLPVYWGNPENGFVGDITGASEPGYGVYHGPIAALINQFLPGRVDDMTGESLDAVLEHVAMGKPVVVWTTSDFQPVSGWVTWSSPSGPVRATFDEHVVLVVGYSPDTVYVNDPLDGSEAKAVPKRLFEETYDQLGRQAVSIQ